MPDVYNQGMELPQGVEWAMHCCWLLAQSDGSAPLPRRRLAEFFELPEPYLAKVLKQLVAAGILDSVPGAAGGYRLALPPEQISALAVVTAVDGGHGMFRCAEIRQRGPVPLSAAQCAQPCGIAKVMHGAELAWRAELARTSIADLVASAQPASEERAAEWLGALARPGLNRVPAGDA
jgi:Rrf2 family protein